MVSRRDRLWLKDANKMELTDYIYGREAYVYRDLGRHWLTEDEARGLVRLLADTFSNEKMPGVSFGGSRTNCTGGHFRITKRGTQYLRVRGTGVNRSNVLHHAVDSKCHEMKVVYQGVPPWRYQVQTILHEFAHYLAYLWWGCGTHDARWCNTSDALHNWYARSRKYRGTMYRMKVVKAVLSVQLSD